MTQEEFNTAYKSWQSLEDKCSEVEFLTSMITKIFTEQEETISRRVRKNIELELVRIEKLVSDYVEKKTYEIEKKANERLKEELDRLNELAHEFINKKLNES